MAVEPRVQQNYFQPTRTPVPYGTDVGTSSIEVLPESMQRVGRIEFWNPGTVNIAICPNKDANGDDFPAVYGAAGTLIVYAGANLTIEPPNNCGWNAIAESGDTNPLTVLVY